MKAPSFRLHSRHAILLFAITCLAGCVTPAEAAAYKICPGGKQVRKNVACPTSPPSFAAQDASVAENAGSVTVVVNKTGATTQSSLVGYTTSGGTAIAGTDYSNMTGSVSVGAAQTSFTISIPVLDNNTIDPTLTFGVKLTATSNATIARNGIVYITDTDAAPLPPPTSTVTYDTSVGNGVDDAGFASLPLRAGAHRYFVNSAPGSGSDGNGCSSGQQPTTPLATIAAAKACAVNGEGDQILLAENTSYAEELGNWQAQMGFNAVYPTVIQSYDSTDALNETKYGRAANGHRPVLTAAMSNPITCCGNGTNSFFAIVGLDFNPGNAPKQCIIFQASSAYILIENNILRAVCLSFDIGSTPRDDHHVVRGNSLYGEWTSDDSHIGGIYNAGTNNITLEDNVFWHNGWKLGISRDTISTLGGPTVFNHPVYMQTNTGTTTMRRNLIADGAADGSSLRGAAMQFTENLSINNPIQLGMGGGVNYYIDNPTGDDLQASYNAFIGSADLNSTNPRNIGATSYNGKPGSTFSHNLLARSQTDGGGIALGVQAFATAAAFNQPSYLNWDHNIVYQWSTAGNELYNGNLDAFPSLAFPTYTNNVWDEPASGTNTNVSTYSPPTPYTLQQLMTAIGYADYSTWIAWAIEHPEQHPARQPRALLFTGYAVP